MAVRFNHTIVHAQDKRESAFFLAEILGLPEPRKLGHFLVLQAGEASLDYLDTDGKVARQHYAFLVSEAEFDEIFERIRARELPYWADPMKRKAGEINHWNEGRGLYFEDPDGHLMEILTRP